MDVINRLYFYMLNVKVSHTDNPSPIRKYVRYSDAFSPNARSALKSLCTHWCMRW